MRFFLFSIFAVMLTACVAPSERGGTATPPPSPAIFEPVNFAGERATPAERSRCEAAGGEVARGGLAGRENCFQPTPDAGKVCGDSSDCFGQCLAPEDSEMGTATTGTCQPITPYFGCFGVMMDGMSGPMLCVD